MPQMLFFRAVQGLSAGVGLIVGRAVVRDALDGDDAQRLMSHISMIFGVAPAIAPIVGGWILGWSNWQAIFWFLSAFSLLLMLTTAIALPESHPPEDRLPLNFKALAARLSRHHRQWPLPTAGPGRHLEFRRAVPVHRLGAGLRAGHPAS